MDDFLISCDAAATFPKNLVHHETYDHNLSAYVKRLDEREPQLFSREENSSLDLLEFDSQSRTSYSISIRSRKELAEFLNAGSSIPNRPDPSSRYVFLHAPNSRERLYTSRKILTSLLTYHQVMPSFLDFIFPFGRQEHTRDFNFTGFRQESRLDSLYKGLAIPELGRSGRELRMCYSLKSVEPSEYQPTMPWSIRQTAVYHSFDIETGKAFWVMVKGDELMKERVEESLRPSQRLKKELAGLERQNEFGSSLAIHMIICDWCVGDWRWYINYLEDSLQNKTRRTLAVKVDSPVLETPEKRSKTVTWSTTSSGMTEKPRLPSISSFKHSSPTSPPQPPDQPTGPPLGPSGPPTRSGTVYSQTGSPINPTKFSFSDLQQVQLIEDRANEVLLILEANVNVLKELLGHYTSLDFSTWSSNKVSNSFTRHVQRFEMRVASIINDLNMQKSRTTTLLSLLADRKRLLYGILEYQNMEASKNLALRAQQSTENMEMMTKDMHTLAQKTKQETVSMRIITLVTLFFLPGTFISTVMSTDIVHWQTDENGNSQRVYQSGALQTFLSACIPIMLVTFAAWYAVNRWVDHQEEVKRRNQMNEIEPLERVY